MGKHSDDGRRELLMAEYCTYILYDEKGDLIADVIEVANISPLKVLADGVAEDYGRKFSYSGATAFLGISLSPNSSTPDFPIGSSIYVGEGSQYYGARLYFCAEPPEPSWHLIDETKETAARTAMANAIRAKTGGTAQLSYDFDGGKGFADAITSDLAKKPAGNIELTQQTGTNVSEKETASVRSGSITLNTPTVNSSGLVTASASMGTSGWIGSAPSNKTLQLQTQGAKTVTPGTTAQTAVESGRYTTGAVTVAGDANLTAGNIASGVSIFGVTGTHAGQKPEQSKTVTPTAAGLTVTPDSGKALSSVVVNGDADLVAGNVKSGVNIFGVTGTYAGEILPDAEDYTFGDPPVLNDTSWDMISAIASTGEAPNYWAVGDRKAVKIQGTVGTLALNTTLYVYILGFNHNGATNTIDFGTFKTALDGGRDVCLVDGKYNLDSSDGTKYFNPNHWGSSSSPYNTNYGGWKGCDARYDILGSTDTAPSGYGSTPTTGRVGYDASATCATNPVPNTLMAALPADLRAVMKPMTVYTDNYGNSSNVESHVTASVDYLPLLAEFEIFGTRRNANQYEKNSQAQYAYYSAGNSRVKYRHSSTVSPATWLDRTPYYDSATGFCHVYLSGGTDATGSNRSFGLAPAFRV